MTRDELERLVTEAMKRVLDTWIPPGYLDQTTAASYLGVSIETIRRWRKQGLPCFVLPPTDGGSRGVLLLRRRDIDAWARRFRRNDA